VSANPHLLTIISAMKRAAAIALALLLAWAPRAQAWGFEAHKFIMERAIALLPPELRPLFERHRATLIERSIDPDTWRTAGFAHDEDPNHFVDLDWQGFGPYPFNGLPRDYTAAIAKFGRTRLQETGTLPWAVEERYGALRRAFEDYARRGVFGQNDIIFFSAWLTHYVSDAHVPFHAVINHDGQLTGQTGIHARFESAMFERYRDRLTIAPTPIPAIKDPRDFSFAVLLQSNQLVPAILKADLDAIGTRDAYDEAYYEAFFKANREVLQRRVNEAIAATAAMITGAWEAAGKPALPVNPPVRPQRRAR
jgi:zinc dependent phospholipase C